MIDQFVLDQIQEREAQTTKIKNTTCKNNIASHYINKKLVLINKRIKILNEGNKKL